MINYKVLQLLFLVSSITSQALIKGMVDQEMITRPTEEVSSMTFQIEGIAQKIEELPKELQYKIFPLALALRENLKYAVYKEFDAGSEVTKIALNADNTRALTGSLDGVVGIWDVENGKFLKELKGHTKDITAVALSADGNIAFTGSWDKMARVWNTGTGELLTTIQVGSPFFSVALSADGSIALIGSQDGIVRLYNTSTGELIKVLKGHTDRISLVALSADGKIALTDSSDGTAIVWNVLTGELLKILQVGSKVYSVSLSADGTIAITKTNNNKVLVWDAKSGILLNTLLPKSIYIYSVALSKDGKRALVGTHEGTIQVWNTKPLPGQKEINTPLTVLKGHTEPVIAVAFGGDDFIASGSSGFDKTVLIWKPFALEPRGPQEHEEVLRQAYKETFSRPILQSTNGN